MLDDACAHEMHVPNAMLNARVLQLTSICCPLYIYKVAVVLSFKVSKTLAKHVKTQLISELARKTGLVGSKTDLANFFGKNGLPGFRTSLASFCGSMVENLPNIIINSSGLHETDHVFFDQLDKRNANGAIHSLI